MDEPKRGCGEYDRPDANPLDWVQSGFYSDCTQIVMKGRLNPARLAICVHGEEIAGSQESESSVQGEKLIVSGQARGGQVGPEEDGISAQERKADKAGGATMGKIVQQVIRIFPQTGINLQPDSVDSLRFASEYLSYRCKKIFTLKRFPKSRVFGLLEGGPLFGIAG